MEAEQTVKDAQIARNVNHTSRDGSTGWFDFDGRTFHVWMREDPRGRCAAHIYSPLGNGHSVPGRCSHAGKHEHNGFKFCSLHLPAKVIARDAERETARKAKNEAISADVRRWEAARRQKDAALEAIKQIAAGHNDPRALAQEVLAMTDAEGPASKDRQQAKE